MPLETWVKRYFTSGTERIHVIAWASIHAPHADFKVHASQDIRPDLPVLGLVGYEMITQIFTGLHGAVDRQILITEFSYGAPPVLDDINV